MNGGYPELRDSVPRIQNVIREEEERFLRNLENGMRMLNDTFRRTKAAGSDTIDGREAFNLHDTYGIPIEITESLAADQNLRVDMAGFKEAQDEARKIARGTAEAADVFATGPLDTLKEAYHHGSEFLGYQTTEADGDGHRHPRAGAARRVGRGLDRPPARRSPWSSTGPRSTPSPAARSATPARSAARGSSSRSRTRRRTTTSSSTSAG